MEPVFDEKNMTFTFEGQSHQVDVETLTSSLIVFSDTLKRINLELNTNKQIEIKITALRPGSFSVDILLSAINNNDLLSAIATVGGVSGAVSGTVWGVYKGIVGIRSFLSNNKEEEIEIKNEGDKIVLSSQNGNTYICSNITYNTYIGSQDINDGISKQFGILENDPSVDGLSISSEEESLSIPKDQFTNLAEKVEVTTENRRKEIRSDQTLKVIKPILERSTTRKWEFVWNNLKISANISDENFQNDLQEGVYRFGPGDTLKVDLQLNQNFDLTLQEWINQSYQVVTVYQHIERENPPDPTPLFEI